MKRLPLVLSLAATMTAAMTALLPSSAVAAIPAAGGPTVSATAATWTPLLATSGTDGSTERIRQLTQCGNTMYAVGRFTAIKRYSVTFTRNNAFSFNATTGVVNAWDPNVNGQVNSVALSADCSTAYLGGTFTLVNGTTVKNIASVSTATAAVNNGFAHSAGGKVNTLTLSGSHLLTGGVFPGINGSTKKYFVSLNAATGKDDGYLNLNISGNYVYVQQDGRASSSNYTQVYNTDLSPDGSKLLAMGVFTSVGGQARRQIFMLDLGATATVDAWYSPEFDQNCHAVEPFYLQAASWAPDMTKVYIATTGYKPATGIGFGTFEPRGGLCDAAAAFPASPSSTQASLWINYTGCDSLYSTAADNNAVYVGGHQRWLESPVQCDGNGNGTKVDSPGMGGIDALSGHVLLDGNGVNPATGDLVGKYSRGRGLGAADMLLTSAGLWIASDNAFNADSCGKTATGTPAYGHMGLCFLPYPPA